MRDRETQRSRGFGFVTYSNQAEADFAIEKMNDTELDGRRMRVNIANARSGGGGGGGGGGPFTLFSHASLFARPIGYGQQGYSSGGYGGEWARKTPARVPDN